MKEEDECGGKRLDVNCVGKETCRSTKFDKQKSRVAENL